jgi:hypothetical protein
MTTLTASHKIETYETHETGRKKSKPKNHTLVFEKGGKGKPLCFCSCKKFRSGVDQFPRFGRVEARSVHVTNYASTPAIFVQSCPSFGGNLDEFLRLLSSFVPIKQKPTRVRHNNGIYRTFILTIQPV